ncbi:MAG TPA: hypothetical protein VIF83_05610 [Gemmatimonadaceae bacterium]
MRSFIHSFIETGSDRVLVCADFAYGYPAGLASLLPKATNGASAPWRVVWDHLASQIKDDLGAKAGRVPTNRNNRFEVASAINATASSDGAPGPFWCLMSAGSVICVPQNQPPQPFVAINGQTIAPRRITDIRARSDTPFRLFGTGSVGSQVLTGIPRIAKIRFDGRLAGCSAVWPFETGWAPANGAWLFPRLRVLHAEIYPSPRASLADSIKDRGQVRGMWHWVRDLDIRNRLQNEFGAPGRITLESKDDLAIRTEEGWILGCP